MAVYLLEHKVATTQSAVSGQTEGGFPSGREEGLGSLLKWQAMEKEKNCRQICNSNCSGKCSEAGYAKEFSHQTAESQQCCQIGMEIKEVLELRDYEKSIGDI